MKCEITPLTIELKKPFGYFLGTLKELPYSKVCITDEYGLQGFGEIAHAVDINGELQASASGYVPYIEQTVRTVSSVETLQDIIFVMSQLRLNIAHNTGLLCGIEQALFSILSQKTGKNLTQILGGSDAENRKIQATISYCESFAEYKNATDNAITIHQADHIKYKVGKNNPLELEILAYCREMYPAVSVSVDANQSFNAVSEAILFAKKLENLGLVWAEQLLPKDAISDLKLLRSQTKIPLMVDEGLHSPLEAEYYAQNKLVDFFNIKLAKTGGVIKALEIIEIAKKYNIPCMLGSMLHGKMGIEYNLGFALSQSFITNDFYSYFSVTETENLGYILADLTVTSTSLYTS